jgi:hypothetical protein
LHARHAQNQLRGIPGRIVREMPKEVLPQALSDAVAVRISLNSAVEGSNVRMLAECTQGVCRIGC